MVARLRSAVTDAVQLGLSERDMDGNSSSDEMAIPLPGIASAFGPVLRMDGDRGMLLFNAQRTGRTFFRTFAVSLRCTR